MRLVFLWLLLVLAGCAGRRVVQPTGLTAHEFWLDQSLRETQLSQIAAHLHLGYEGPKQSVSGRGALVRVSDRAARLEIHDPLGRTQYLLAQSGSHVIAYYPSQRRAFIDESGGRRYFERFLALPFTTAQAEQIWLGILPKDLIANARFTDWRWDEGEGAYRASLIFAGRPMVCEIDGSTAALRAITWNAADGAVQFHYADFEPCCSQSLNAQRVALAQTVSMKVAAKGLSLELDLSQVEPLAKAPPETAFTPRLPSDVEKILLN